MLTPEFDQLFSSPYSDILRARELFVLDGGLEELPSGITMKEVDEICLEAYESGFLDLVGNGQGAHPVDFRSSMKAVKDDELSRRDYRRYIDGFIEEEVMAVQPVYITGEEAGIAVSSRGGLPYERPLFERLHDATTGFTQQTRHEVSMEVASVASKMGSFANRHTYAVDWMCATGGSLIDLIMQARDSGGEKSTALVGFSSPQGIARLFLSRNETGLVRVISLPLESGLISPGEEQNNFIFGGVEKKFENLSDIELEAIMSIFMLGDHGNRYYQELTETH